MTDPQEFTLLFDQVDAVGNHSRAKTRGKTGSQIHAVCRALKQDHLRLLCLRQPSDGIRIELCAVDREVSALDENSPVRTCSERFLCSALKGVMFRPCQQCAD